MKIEESLLDELIPVPDKFTEANEIKEELEEAGMSPIYWEDGGLFKTLIMIFLLIKEELLYLLRHILKNSYLATAEGVWLDLKAQDYSRTRKKPLRTVGKVTLKRNRLNGTIKIPVGYIFKTEMDSSGKEYRFIVEKEQFIQDYESTCDIEVVAEETGEEYNLPENKIVKSVQHIEEITEITNLKNWIIREGSSEEDDEQFRERVQNWWDELAQLPTGAKYRAIAMNVPGVMNCFVDDLHPRGQGTIDIILIGPSGVPSQELIDDVTKEIKKVQGPYDDIQYLKPSTQKVDIAVQVTIAPFREEQTIKAAVEKAIEDLLKTEKGKILTHIYIAEIVKRLMSVDGVNNIVVTSPSTDISTTNKTILQLGTKTVTVKRA